MWQAYTKTHGEQGVLHTARISTVEVIMSIDKWINIIVNFKLGNDGEFSRSCHIDQFTFHILLPSLKFTIFIHSSLLTMTLTVLILA